MVSIDSGDWVFGLYATSSTVQVQYSVGWGVGHAPERTATRGDVRWALSTRSSASPYDMLTHSHTAMGVERPGNPLPPLQAHSDPLLATRQGY